MLKFVCVCVCLQRNVPFLTVALCMCVLILFSSQTKLDNECVFSKRLIVWRESERASELALHLAPSRIMHIYAGMNRQNPLKRSNVRWLLLIKLLKLRQGMCLCSPDRFITVARQ